MPSLTKICKLVDECLLIDDTYVNLDTGRKNKKSTMEKKKDIFINHDYKIFSVSNDVLITFLRGIKLVKDNFKSLESLEATNHLPTTKLDPVNNKGENTPLTIRGNLPDQPVFPDENDNETNNETGDVIKSLEEITPWISTYINGNGKDEDVSSNANSEYYSVMNLFSTVNRLFIAPLLAESISGKTDGNQLQQGSPPISNNIISKMTKKRQQITSNDFFNQPALSSQKPQLIQPTKLSASSKTYISKKAVLPKDGTNHKIKNKSKPSTKSVSKPSDKSKPSSKPVSKPSDKPKPSTKPVSKPSNKPKPSTKSNGNKSGPKNSVSKPTSKQSDNKGKGLKDDTNETKGIPSAVRFQVWRKWCGNVMDGKCFCCHEMIPYEKWHCGHIVARAKDGSIDPDNLRPTCLKCNLGMGTMHMYEWIIMNGMAGIADLSLDDPLVKFHIAAVESAVKTGERIDWLEDKGFLNKTKANEYRRKIVSKRADTVRRIEVMEEVAAYHRKFQVTDQ